MEPSNTIHPSIFHGSNDKNIERLATSHPLETGVALWELICHPQGCGNPFGLYRDRKVGIGHLLPKYDSSTSF